MKNKNLAYIEGFVSIIINTILFGLKLWAGMLCRSVAMIADAWHTLSDSFTSIVVILGVKIAVRPPDKKHPFGHGRAELIASIIIGTLLAIVGFNFLIESVQKLRSHETASYNIIAVIVFIASVILKEGLARYSVWAGKKTGSRSLLADGWHHRSDAIASAIILLGIFIGKYIWWIDSVMGIIVSLLIFYATFEILRESVSILIGEEPTEEFYDKLHAVVSSALDRNVNIHHIHVHRYGSHRELTFHINLSPSLTIAQAHTIADKLEESVKHELDIEATIHVEPERKD
ncbi:cation diffusion facilitator family transporter [Spirochaetota bacterium]